MLGCAVVLAGAGSVPDAKGLVGDWTGEWRSRTGSGGNILLTIDSAGRDEVRGTIFIEVAAPDRGYYNRELAFTGGFDHGAIHIWLPPNLTLMLKVEGRRMRGSVQAQYTFGAVELQRR